LSGRPAGSISRPVLSAGFIPPCLPTKAQEPPSGRPWWHEIKHDGFRIIARKDGSRDPVHIKRMDIKREGVGRQSGRNSLTRKSRAWRSILSGASWSWRNVRCSSTSTRSLALIVSPSRMSSGTRGSSSVCLRLASLILARFLPSVACRCESMLRALTAKILNQTWRNVRHAVRACRSTNYCGGLNSPSGSGSISMPVPWG
jgi:hypothetical protein